MRKKAASNITTIAGSDGSTSVFVCGKQGLKKTFKQRLYKMQFQFRRKRVEKKIRANYHSMEQVVEYIKAKWGYSEVSHNDSEYKSEHKQMCASLLLQHKPQLLGKLAANPKLKDYSEKEIQSFMEQQKKRQKAAEEICESVIDVDLHILKKEDSSLDSRIFLESKYEYVGSSVSGSKKAVKAFNKMYREIYKYYGVSQRDIDEKSDRYEALVRALAGK